MTVVFVGVALMRVVRVPGLIAVVFVLVVVVAHMLLHQCCFACTLWPPAISPMARVTQGKFAGQPPTSGLTFWADILAWRRVLAGPLLGERCGLNLGSE